MSPWLKPKPQLSAALGPVTQEAIHIAILSCNRTRKVQFRFQSLPLKWKIIQMGCHTTAENLEGLLEALAVKDLGTSFARSVPFHLWPDLTMQKAKITVAYPERQEKHLCSQ